MTLKKTISIFRFNFFAALLIVGMFSCKKTGNTGCGISGGVISPNTYIFWIAQDFGCGSITVEVKESGGAVVMPYQDQISYTSATAPDCNNTNYGKYATFDLYQGKNYTYSASCSGKSWNGTIAVPCEQNQCKSVQLK